MPFDTTHNGRPFPADDEPDLAYLGALTAAMGLLNVRVEVGRYRKSDEDVAQVEAYHRAQRLRLRSHWSGRENVAGLRMTSTSARWMDPETGEAYQIVYVRVDRQRSRLQAVAS